MERSPGSRQRPAPNPPDRPGEKPADPPAARPGPPRHLSRRLKLRQLQVICAIADHRTLSKAAFILGITQPALTKSLQEIESAVGVRLFDRLARGAIATVYGQAVIDRGRRILAEMDRIEQHLDQVAAADVGELVIGALPVASAGLLPQAVQSLTQSHPGLSVRIRQGAMEVLLAALAAGELDIMVGRLIETRVPDSFQREELYREPMSVMVRAGHPLLERKPATMDDLAACTLVLPALHQIIGQEIDRQLVEHGAPPPGHTLRSSAFAFIRETIINTDLVTVLPRMMLAGDLLRGTVRVVETSFTLATGSVGIVWPSHRLRPPAAQALAAALRAHIARMRTVGLLE